MVWVDSRYSPIPMSSLLSFIQNIKSNYSLLISLFSKFNTSRWIYYVGDTDHSPVKGTQFASCRNQYKCHCVLAKCTGLLNTTTLLCTFTPSRQYLSVHKQNNTYVFRWGAGERKSISA